MDFNKQRELINNLIGEMSNMVYKSNSSNLSDFQIKGEIILNKIFGKRSSHIEKFNSVKFYPTYTTGNDDYDNSIKFNSFQDGKTSMLSVLQGALTEIEMNEVISLPEVTELTKSNKVFIVHGHDDGLKNEVARFVERLDLEAVILHEQANAGNTIIEKIEKNSDVGFAIVLYTPCDEGKSKSSEQLRSRARQNVIFEHGYFIARLGRSNVVALHKGEDLELPNDISGVVYVKYENGAWKYEIAKEMLASGYKVDMNKI